MSLDWRRVVVYTHRWLGIAGCALFVAWFGSGIVLMYAGMPELNPQDQRAILPPLDLSSARVSPADAQRSAGLSAERVRVGMFGARPVYRMLEHGRWTVVFADTGERWQRLAHEQVLAEVRRFEPAHAPSIAYDALIGEPDQWTFGERASMPLHRVRLHDAADTVYYLSDRTGEPVMRTTASTRRWAYAGAVMHWLYFTPFRRHSQLWAQSIIWVSIAGCLLCLSGLLWGVWRFSMSARYRLRRIPSRSPYATWMRWHHYAGLFFGLTTFTWIFSGLLSMDPWNWHPDNEPTVEQQAALSGGPLATESMDLAGLRRALADFGAAGDAPREIEAIQFLKTTYYAADGRLAPSAPESAAPRVFTSFAREAVSAAVSRAVPGAHVAEAAWLDRYDAYYYDRGGSLPLPVLRVKFDDPPRTWLYADASRGALVLKEESLSRLNRWLYHGFHSFDFPALYYRRPLWDLLLIALSLGGIVSSASAVVPAMRRLRRHGRRPGA